MSQVIGIILARGGSVGLPRKNVRPFLGEPLIVRAVRTLLAVPVVDDVIVSTDDDEIAALAERAGARVPFRRPAELAGATATSVAALEHAVRELDRGGDSAEFVISYQATSPLVTPADIDAAFATFRSSGATQLKSVTEVREHPQWMLRVENGRVAYLEAERATRRQDLPPLYRLDGALNIYTVPSLLAPGGELDDPAAFVLAPDHSIDIDDERDWLWAEHIARLHQAH